MFYNSSLTVCAALCRRPPSPSCISFVYTSQDSKCQLSALGATLRVELVILRTNKKLFIFVFRVPQLTLR